MVPFFPCYRISFPFIYARRRALALLEFPKCPGCSKDKPATLPRVAINAPPLDQDSRSHTPSAKTHWRMHHRGASSRHRTFPLPSDPFWLHGEFPFLRRQRKQRRPGFTISAPDVLLRRCKMKNACCGRRLSPTGDFASYPRIRCSSRSLFACSGYWRFKTIPIPAFRASPIHLSLQNHVTYWDSIKPVGTEKCFILHSAFTNLHFPLRPNKGKSERI